jgi:hypothetical protein
MLIKRGTRVVTASDEDPTEASDPSRVMMRQIAGSFAQENGMSRPLCRRWSTPSEGLAPNVYAALGRN